MATQRFRKPPQSAALWMVGLTVSGTLVLSATLMAQSELEETGRTYLEGARQTELGYSRAVVTRGGDTIWVSGTAGPRDSDGQPITDFQEQARQAYRNLDATLREIGSDLSDVVNVTVLLGDAAHAGRHEGHELGCCYSDRRLAGSKRIVPTF